MKQTVSRYDFTEAFRKIRPDNFSYAGLQALFDYFENYEEETGEEMELDVIAICCDFCEYEDLADFQSYYGEEYETMADVNNATIVIPVGEYDEEGEGRFIVQSF